jgi:hypothetical protein
LALVVHYISSIDVERAVEAIELNPDLLLQHQRSLLSTWEQQPIKFELFPLYYVPNLILSHVLSNCVGNFNLGVVQDYLERVCI